MARSSRRRGEKIPGVSTKMSWACPPWRCRAAGCAWSAPWADDRDLAADQRVDQRRLAGVGGADQRDKAAARAAGRWARPLSHRGDLFDALALKHGLGSGLFGGTLGAADSLGSLALWAAHGYAELRIVVRSGAFDLAVGRRRQAALLRPFLQYGLRVAQRPRRRAHPFAPEPFHQLGGCGSRRRGRPRPPGPRRRRRGSRRAGARRRSPPRRRAEGRAEFDRARHVGAGLASARDRPAGATIRPRRPSERRETACRR